MRCTLSILFLLLSVLPSPAANVSAPFPTGNQGVLQLQAQLPPPFGASILPEGTAEVSARIDLASTYLYGSNSHESILLDGESWATTLHVRRGIGGGLEFGIEIPWTGVGGGTFDSFIIDWHNFFSLPQGGREKAPKGKIRYDYLRDGKRLLAVNASSSGLGDVRLSVGKRIADDATGAVSLRGAVSLPTGSPDQLRGRGSVAAATWISADTSIPTDAGIVGFWTSLGGELGGEGDILPDQRNRAVGFGRCGIGWEPISLLDFKLELLFNTPLFRGSGFTALSGYGLILVTGGSINLSRATSIDIGVSEDLNVGSAADVALHLGVRHTF